MTMMLDCRSLDSPDETRRFDNGHVDVVKVGGVTIGRTTLEPGWRWSESVKPIAGTDSCLEPHTGYVLSGRLRVRMDDGTEGEAAAGDAVVIAPGHDAWVIGQETCVLLDFSGAEHYAR